MILETMFLSESSNLASQYQYFPDSRRNNAPKIKRFAPLDSAQKCGPGHILFHPNPSTDHVDTCPTPPRPYLIWLMGKVGTGNVPVSDGHVTCTLPVPSCPITNPINL